MCSGVECTNQRDVRVQSPSEAVYIKPFSLLAMHTLLEVNFIYNWFATTNTFWIEMKVKWVTFTINLTRRCFLFIYVLVSKTLIQIIYIQYLCDGFWCFSLRHHDSCLGLSTVKVISDMKYTATIKILSKQYYFLAFLPSVHNHAGLVISQWPRGNKRFLGKSVPSTARW